MGKSFYTTYSDSDETGSSTDKLKKKSKNSTKKLKSNLKKKRSLFKSQLEQDDYSYRNSRSSPSSRSSRSSSRSSVRSSRSKTRGDTMLKQKLRGILKHTPEKESTDEDEVQPWSQSQGRCLIGQVPQLPGAKPGQGGGFAFVIRRNVNENNFPSHSAAGNKQKKSNFRGLSQKRSF